MAVRKGLGMWLKARTTGNHSTNWDCGDKSASASVARTSQTSRCGSSMGKANALCLRGAHAIDPQLRGDEGDLVRARGGGQVPTVSGARLPSKLSDLRRVLCGPKSSFRFFHTMSLVVLSCL